MGRKLDALLGRNFKVSKFKTIAKLAISRSTILSNQHQIRFSHARSDVKGLLHLNHQDRALLRVEHVIMEQNMLDALAMVQYYCHLLNERVKLLGKKKGESCPEELKEAASSLVYAASRCGEFPELQKIREILTSKFGKEFSTRAVELRNNCGVSPKMVQKFSTRRPSIETRLKVLKEIASECGVTLDLEEDDPVNELKEKLDMNQKQEQTEPTQAANLDDTALKLHNTTLSEEIKQDERFTESMKARRKYRDVVDAAQEAFESAAYAAAAARAAVELSLSKSIDKGSEGHDGPDNQGGSVSHFAISSTAKTHMINAHAASRETEDLDNRQSFEKIQTAENLSSESESEVESIEHNSHNNINHQEVAEKRKKPIQRKPSSSNSNTDKRDSKTWLQHHDLGTYSKPSFLVNENKHNRLANATRDDLSDEGSIKLSFKSTK